MEKSFEGNALLQVLTEGKQPPNCDLTLQIKANYAQEGIARGVWKVDEKFINGNGVAMGGFVTSAADIIMAYAISSKLSIGQSFASIDLHTTFHRPVRLGDVQVEAKVDRIGKKTAYLLADLFQDDKKVASVVSSAMIL
ncbi:PaaI family thioesterase [Peribacillus simplex]|uniref:PaaI family thioesterase n=1 Tax=Peribacillus simplex TaxID=1478 RepID=A0AAW7IJC7_9BACI|nr:PaaI family thioesterase [Peribacillus simplex]MDM5454117.1 PaaI family thioesterase [Peribacillus simplex]